MNETCLVTGTDSVIEVIRLKRPNCDPNTADPDPFTSVICSKNMDSFTNESCLVNDTDSFTL